MRDASGEAVVKPVGRLLCVLLLAGCSTAGGRASVDAGGTAATGPVRRLELFVTPYYEAAKKPGDRPHVEVGKEIDEALSSDRRQDILAVRDAVQKGPATVAPVTMMVLAVRLYDVGMRDDAVFWFHVARLRYATMTLVLDTDSPDLSPQSDAVRSFLALAGPSIDAYSLCDRSRRREILRTAFDWVVQNPYQILFLDRFQARPGDRSQNLERALETIRATERKSEEALADPAARARLERTWSNNGLAEQYCWPDAVTPPGGRDANAFREKARSTAMEFVARAVAGDADSMMELSSPFTIQKAGRDALRRDLVEHVVPAFRGKTCSWNPGVRFVSADGFPGAEVSGVYRGDKPSAFYVYVFEENGRFVVGTISSFSGL